LAGLSKGCAADGFSTFLESFMFF